jgi:competence ComEA-like helix-hairpin-helix protein
MATINGKQYAPGIHEIDGYLVHVIDEFAAKTVGKAPERAAAPVSEPERVVAEDGGNKRAERVNVNKASADELADLNGVSETVAGRIIESRPFETVYDLTRVRGIGKARVDALREQITA